VGLVQPRARIEPSWHLCIPGALGDEHRVVETRRPGRGGSLGVYAGERCGLGATDLRPSPGRPRMERSLNHTAASASRWPGDNIRPQGNGTPGQPEGAPDTLGDSSARSGLERQADAPGSSGSRETHRRLRWLARRAARRSHKRHLLWSEHTTTSTPGTPRAEGSESAVSLWPPGSFLSPNRNTQNWLA
jgi:hypothetical protein